MVVKKQVNVRLNPGTIDMIKQIQDYEAELGFSSSQAIVIENAVSYLYTSMFPDREDLTDED